MKSTHALWLLVNLVGTACLADSSPADSPTVRNLAGSYRSGQVFLMWSEAETPPGTTFNVYAHGQAITVENLDNAERIGHHVEPRSARDWWKDRSSFFPDETESPEVAPPAEGFVIETGGAPLDPAGGLFVHTVTEQDVGARYYAVVPSRDGKEEQTLRLGENSLENPIDGTLALPLPVWIDETAPAPERGSASGKRLTLILHGRGGGHASIGRPGAHSALAFGDAKQGWREGLAYKFQVKIDDEGVTLRPYDLAWTGRAVAESIDAFYRARAVVTWWYGYDRKIYQSIDGPVTVAPNYSEERLLWMVRWAQDYLGTDPHQTYVRGGSMGGSGAVSMALHHPHVFAAVKADVPIVAYTRAGKRGSLWRLECIMGKLDAGAVTHTGAPLLEHMNGTVLVKKLAKPEDGEPGRGEPARVDLPPLFITNGRQDGSIPWENNPSFYRAMNDARQSLSAYWSDGGHGMHRQAPDDVKAWNQEIYRYRLNESYLVFTNSSDNRDPGNGDPQDGDLVGWYHRGLEWTDLVDSETEYSFTAKASHPELKAAVEVDITPRRVQRFHPEPNSHLSVTIDGEASPKLKVDATGLLTISRVRLLPGRATKVRVLR